MNTKARQESGLTREGSLSSQQSTMVAVPPVLMVPMADGPMGTTDGALSDSRWGICWRSACMWSFRDYSAMLAAELI